MAGQPPTGETEKWSAYPSWKQFTWLYFLSLVSGLRGGLLLWFEVSGGEVWIGGAAILLVCVVILRYWAQYSLTSHRIIVSNGYTGRKIHAMAISDIREVTVTQGFIGQFMSVGTLVFHSTSEDHVLSLRGINDPEVIKTRIEALMPTGNSLQTQHATSL
jgi:hypothetical protein